MRIETPDIDEGMPGFAFSNGMMTSLDMSAGLQYTGGIPLTGTPTSLSGFIKYNFPFMDFGGIVIDFKRQGASVGQIAEPFVFGTADYVQVDIAITGLTDIPDTAFIVFLTSNPEDPQPGGWLQVDSLWFSGVTDTIPNCDFEEWEDKSYSEPSDWLTGNLFTYLFGGDTSATRTTDAYAGDYALRLENVTTQFPTSAGFADANLGYMIPYAEGYNFYESIPSFPIDFNPTSLTGYYKFTPAVDDTALIHVVLTDTEENTYEMNQLLFEQADYTSFTLDFDYPYNVVINEISIVAGTSQHIDPINDDPSLSEPGSVLFLDELELLQPTCSDPFTITVVQEPSCENDTIILDAGDGWGSIYWSNEDTTRYTNFQVTEAGNIKCIVTASDSWCFYVDSVEFNPPTGCEDAIPALDMKSDFVVFPNPSEGILNLSITNDNGPFHVEIYSAAGQLIFFDTFEKRSVELKLNELSPGIYYLKLNGELKTQHKSFTIK
jgi:hypothetical protein